MLTNLTSKLKRWEEHLVTRGSRRAYTLLFVPFCLAVFAGLLTGGRELMWYIDGLNQYYPFFIYEGQWIRGIVHSLFSGGGLQVPLWEWCSGYGADIPTTFDVFLDPLNLVSAITPEGLSEWVFQLLVLLRLYLAGLAFVYYCEVRGENKTGTVLGALLYALCGAGLVGIRWSSGLHALMLFPVILAGAEKILKGERPWVFVASCTLLAIISYYFTYMAIILLIGYLVIRVAMIEKPRLTPRRFLAWAGRFALLVVLCLLLAGFALVPAACALLGMDRLAQTQADVPLLYGATYYMRLVTQFLSTFEVGSDTYQGFGGMAFFGCLLLFADKDSNRALKVTLVVLTVFLLLPFVGSFLNVMNYASNRWAWAYDMCMAFVLVRATPRLLACDHRNQRVLMIGTACYALLLAIPVLRTEANVAGMAALLGALIMVAMWRNPQLRRSALALGMMVTLGTNGLYYVRANNGAIGSDQVPMGAAYNLLTTNSIDSLATRTGDGDWWRYDASQSRASAKAPVARVRNNSLVLGLQGIDFYNSVYNDHIDAFHTEMAIAGDAINFSFTDLQSRSDLMALLGVRYFAYRNDGTDAVPYGYDAANPVLEDSVWGVDYSLLKSGVALPLGVAFDKTISRDDYLQLSPAQRQQALLQAVVVANDRNADGVGASAVQAQSLTYEDSVVPFSVASATNVAVEDGRFVVSAAGGTVTLNVSGIPSADTYVYFKGLNYEPMAPSSYVTDEQRDNMAWYSRAKLLLEDLKFSPSMTHNITLWSDVCAASALIVNCTPSNHMYGGKDTWLANLGYAQKAAGSIHLTFSQPGAYTFEDLQVVAQTHEHQGEWTDARKAQALQDLTIGCNQVSGSIDLDAPQTLLLTMAYNRGWSAWVDGKPAEILVADTGFMALDLGAGHHDIELRYTTPGLAAGFAVSGAGVILLVANIAIRKLVHAKGGKK